MIEEETLISITTSPDGSEVELHLNRNGIASLISILRHLDASLDSGECDHAHLFSQSWGGSDLTESKLNSEHRQVYHLKLYSWNEEWKKKHDL